MPSIIINVSFALSVILPLTGGILQNIEETKVQKANPGKFPEAMSVHVKRAIQDWRAGKAPEG